MPKQSVIVATENKRAVENFVLFFQDTESAPTIIRKRSDFAIVNECEPDYLFIEAGWVDGRFQSRLNELRARRPALKCFALGSTGESVAAFRWDGILHFPVEEREIQKAVLSHNRYPKPLKLVVVDDDPEVLEVFGDFLSGRRDFDCEVRTAANGLEGFKLIEAEQPHCLVLDIKMPVKTGVELYRDLIRGGWRAPTVFFIDVTAADDILEIRKWGSPVFAEKGGAYGSMPAMLALIKKLVTFS